MIESGPTNNIHLTLIECNLQPGFSPFGAQRSAHLASKVRGFSGPQKLSHLRGKDRAQYLVPCLVAYPSPTRAGQVAD
jgi:hypothetical protein